MQLVWDMFETALDLGDDADRYDSVGNILVIHCSGGQNGVVVTGREGFAVAARPDLFTD